MDDPAAQLADALQRERHVSHGEIRQRCRVSRSAAAGVDSDRWPLTAGLTAGALALDALLEAVVEQPFPKTARPLRVIRGKLDQRQPCAGHPPKATAAGTRPKQRARAIAGRWSRCTPSMDQIALALPSCAARSARK